MNEEKPIKNKEDTFHQKFCNIQQGLKSPKGNINEFGKYKYRSCEDILQAVKPLLQEQECVLLLTDEIIQVGTRFYVKSIATLRHENVAIRVSAYARESEEKRGMDASQITGAASSYARKYALNGLFCIDDTKDADTMNHQSEEAQDTGAKYSCTECGVDVDAKVYKYSTERIGKALCFSCQKKQKTE